MFRGVSTVITLNVTSKLPPSLYLMTVPRLRDGTVCKNRDKPIKYTVRVGFSVFGSSSSMSLRNKVSSFFLVYVRVQSF